MDDLQVFIVLEVGLVGIFAVLGLKPSWREAVVAFALITSFVAYICSLPLSPDPAEEVGQQVTRLALFAFLVGCVVAFAGSFGISVLRGRISQKRSEIAGK
jgi:hypothetical protein